jgi:hypothetical protein
LFSSSFGFLSSAFLILPAGSDSTGVVHPVL